MNRSQVIELGKLQHKNNVDKGFHDSPSTRNRRLVLIHGEVSEASETLRMPESMSAKIPKFTAYREELSDVILRILAFAVTENMIEEFNFPENDLSVKYDYEEDFLIELHDNLSHFHMLGYWQFMWKIIGMINARYPDIWDAAQAKFEYNTTRPYLHGKSH